MSEAIQGNNSYVSAGIPVKRKRGRPRKDRSLYRVASVRPRKHENLHRMENASVPPGFPVFNGDHVDPVEDTSSGLVGQAVTGVIESEFDDGYLLAVKIGNSNITLKGVLFKPGHNAPLTAENDVAPRVQMIRRKEILLPTQNQSHIRRPRSRERHEQNAGFLGNGLFTHPLATKLVSSKDKCTAIVAAPSVPLVGSRGTVVPVVLAPVNAVAAQAAHMAALKDKQVHTVAPLSTYDPNKSAPDLLQSHTIPHVVPKDVNSENGSFGHRSLELRQFNEGKSMNSMKMSLPVKEEFQGGSQSAIAQDYSSVPELETGDMNEPLFVEPLRAVHANYHIQSPFVSNLVGHNGIGRMTELLQAVQENMKENQVHPEHLPASFSKAESSEQKIQGSGLGEEV